MEFKDWATLFMTAIGNLVSAFSAYIAYRAWHDSRKK